MSEGVASSLPADLGAAPFTRVTNATPDLVVVNGCDAIVQVQ
jgi:hypothetical protein